MSKPETATQEKKRLAIEAATLNPDEAAAAEQKRLDDEAAAKTIEVDLICISYHEDSDKTGNKVCYFKGDVIEGLTEEKAYKLVERKKAIYASKYTDE
jgi:hypothetical protein